MVQVPTAATYSSSHFAPFTPSPTLTFPPASSNTRFTPAPYQDSISGVSLSLIQTDHDVINSSSVIQKAGCSPAAAQQTSQSEERMQATEICQQNPLCGCPNCTPASNQVGDDASAKAQGPLTRSRKRRLRDGEACSETQGPIDLK